MKVFIIKTAFTNLFSNNLFVSSNLEMMIKNTGSPERLCHAKHRNSPKERGKGREIRRRDFVRGFEHVYIGRVADIQ